ncbi:MAG: phosphoenolpyruvate--protein phosphotransferase [Planctomycetes bacterium]|nr:phosphoenolpyruvate--protein phosphotransferase [Planctomycetota bacterium]
MDQIKLLCDIGELNHLFRDSASVENILHEIVELVAEHIRADVCTIWLYDEDSDELVVRATKGLSEDTIGHVKMRLGEGLAGKTLKELRPIVVSQASKHPDYKLFIGTGEEQYDNFLAVPISRGINRIGVLVLRRKKKKRFIEEDILACKAVASQLANVIENAKFVMAMHAPVEKNPEPAAVADELLFVRGNVASEGFAFGEAVIADSDKSFSRLLKRRFAGSYGREDFERAVVTTQVQLQELQSRVERKLSDAASLIFASHLMILKDKEFVGAMAAHIENGMNAADAILDIAKSYIDIFSGSDHAYVREKVQDVEDLVLRLIGNLTGRREDTIEYAGGVVVARELFPSDLLRMSSEGVEGIVLVSGGVTSHLSILARSLEIPIVIANEPKLLGVENGTTVLIDAELGNVYVSPSDEIVKSFIKRNEARQTARQEDIQHVTEESYTRDNVRVDLAANINLLSDLKLACEMKCKGVGLYRTEFPFIIRQDFPSEQEQYATYRKLIESMDGKEVVFRTLDIGGDKVLSYYKGAHEQNPGMGMRSIRFSLGNREVFQTQLRAILRAGLGADIGIMFPMVSALEEFGEAKEIVRLCSDELNREGVKHNDKPKIGMMVELPSVVALADEFAEQVDFFSIGTNDFIQFMLGVDRTNENVAGFYIPCHPSVLRGIARVVTAAEKFGKPISVCGDMAHDEHYLAFLLGVGIRTLSVEAGYIARIQRAVGEIDIMEARELAERVLQKSDIRSIEKLLRISVSNE